MMWALAVFLAVPASCEGRLEADPGQKELIGAIDRLIQDMKPAEDELKALFPRYVGDPDLAPLAPRRDALRKSLQDACDKLDEAREKFERSSKELRAREMFMLVLRSAKGAPQVDKSLGPVLVARDFSDKAEAALNAFRGSLADDETRFQLAVEGRAKARRYRTGFFISLAVMGLLAILDVALIFKRVRPELPPVLAPVLLPARPPPALPAPAVPPALPAILSPALPSAVPEEPAARIPSAPAFTAGFMSFVGITAFAGSCLVFAYLDDIGSVSTRRQFLEALAAIRSFLIGSALLASVSALVSGLVLGLLEKGPRYKKAAGLGVLEWAICAAAFAALSLPGWYVELISFIPFPAVLCGAVLGDPKAWKQPAR